MSDKPDQNIKTEEEVSNVDLQFMGRTNTKAEHHATVEAESQAAAAAAQPHKEGLTKNDVILTQTMDASDPPSTNMGDTNE